MDFGQGGSGRYGEAELLKFLKFLLCVYFVFQSKKLFLFEGFPKGVLKNFSMGSRGWGGGYI